MKIVWQIDDTANWKGVSLQKWSSLIVEIEPISQSRVQNINTK